MCLLRLLLQRLAAARHRPKLPARMPSSTLLR